MLGTSGLRDICDIEDVFKGGKSTHRRDGHVTPKYSDCSAESQSNFIKSRVNNCIILPRNPYLAGCHEISETM